MSDEQTEAPNSEIKEISFAEFLETYPPNQPARINSIWGMYHYPPEEKYRGVTIPEIRLHCPHDACNGTRYFRCISKPPRVFGGEYINGFLTYLCWNCQKTQKTFSIAVKLDEHPKGFLPSGDAIKFGEAPPFGPQTSSKLIKLIGPDRDAFLKGRRCENQGLGIGAFVYYRRVVENQKNRILSEIVRVAERVGASRETISILKSAITEIQFSKAMDLAKPAIPQSLLINGHNPLALLHSALSEGVHELSDSECLSLAGVIRIVLGELSERLAQALKDEDELKQALGTLMSRKKS